MPGGLSPFRGRVAACYALRILACRCQASNSPERDKERLVQLREREQQQAAQLREEQGKLAELERRLENLENQIENEIQRLKSEPKQP